MQKLSNQPHFNYINYLAFNYLAQNPSSDDHNC